MISCSTKKFGAILDDDISVIFLEIADALMLTYIQANGQVICCLFCVLLLLLACCSFHGLFAIFLLQLFSGMLHLLHMRVHTLIDKT